MRHAIDATDEPRMAKFALRIFNFLEQPGLHRRPRSLYIPRSADCELYHA